MTTDSKTARDSTLLASNPVSLLENRATLACKYTPTEIQVLKDSFTIRMTLDEHGKLHEDIGTGILKASPTPARLPISETLGTELFGTNEFQLLLTKARRSALLELLHRRLNTLDFDRLFVLLEMSFQ